MAAPKNKLKALVLCLLVGLSTVVDARKVATRVSKAPSHRGYANPDAVKLSYGAGQGPVGAKSPSAPPSPVHSSAPYSPQSAPSGQLSGHSYGWNSPQGSQYGGAGGTGVVAGNAYRSHGHNATAGGFGGGSFAPPPAPGLPPQPIQGFPGAPVPQPGGGFPPAYPPQQYGGYQPQAGFPHQPAYSPMQPHGYGQPGLPDQHYHGQPGATVTHHVHQPSGGSGIGTVLGAGVAGLAAGVGGAALYDAFKPKDEPTSAAPAAVTPAAPAAVSPAAGETTSAATPAPASASSDVPLASTPAEIVPLASFPVSETSTNENASENPLGMAPLATTSDAPVSLASMPDASSTAGSTESSTPVPLATTEVVVTNSHNAALNAQPNLSASVDKSAMDAVPVNSLAPRLTAGFTVIALLLPAFAKYFLL